MSASEEMLAVSRAQEELPELVSAIYDFWRLRRSTGEGEGEGIIRAVPEAAGNDTCPCGSSKNYKQCCGSPERLH